MGIPEQNKDLKHGIMKMAYFRCACGQINYLNNILVRPDHSFRIDVVNNREYGEADVWQAFRCFSCKQTIEFGITANFKNPLQDN